MRRKKVYHKSHCTSRAVSLKLLDDVVHLALAHLVLVREQSHDIRYFLATSVHLHIVCVKCHVTAVIGLKTDRNKPVNKLFIEI